MVADVLNCKSQRVYVCQLIHLSLEKDVVLELGGVKTAKEWTVDNVKELLDPEGSEMYKIKWPFFGFLDRWIVFTSNGNFSSDYNRVGIIDKDGLEELKKEATVKLVEYYGTSLSDLLKYTCCGFIKAGDADMERATYEMKMQDAIAKCLQDNVVFSGNDDDCIKFKDFKKLFTDKYMELDTNEAHREFCGHFYRIVEYMYRGLAEKITSNNVPAVACVRWRNE